MRDASSGGSETYRCRGNGSRRLHICDISVLLQRGDAEMAQKLWRVVRACVELGPKNPIQQIHDQGAGGNCNVVSPEAEMAVGQGSSCPGYQPSKEDLLNVTT